MKVTLSFEKTLSSDVSIMVDVLRASTTITLALDNFDEIIPCFSPDEAFKLKNKTGGILAGERGGEKIDGFDVGNSPDSVKNIKSDSDTLILTTSNGTRILKDMNSKVLIGSLINAEAVAKSSVKIAESHIDIVMAGVKGNFALEDFLASGEIIYQISQICKNCEIDEYGKSAVMATRDYNMLKNAFFDSNSAKRLIKLGYKQDIETCLLKNTSNNVGIYENSKINRLDLNI